MNSLKLFKKLSLLIITLGITVNIMAAGSAETMPANINSKDTISLQKGARTYMNYCVACHSMEYMRYDALVEFLEIPADIVEKNLMFSGTKTSDHITNSMSKADAQQWFGKAPPDLTLIGRVRGADWLYTYLKSFYTDNSRPFNVNNTLFKDVGMPHVLAPLQGVQVKSATTVELEAKVAAANIAKGVAMKASNTSEVATQQAIIDEATLAISDLKHNGTYFEISKAGTMTAEEYDVVVRDLVNFMDFAGEPGKLERHALGVKVIIFLLIFFVFAYFLKKEYWRDIH